MYRISNDRALVISRMEPEEREFLTQVVTEIEKSSINPDLPVLYPGSASDVEHAILLGKNIVFIDSHLPETNIGEIKSKLQRMGEILQENRVGVLGKGGKYFFKFKLDKGDEEYNLTYYAEDAAQLSKLGIEELKCGYSVYFVKVPLPKEKTVGSLTSPESLGEALSGLVTDGFYLERECPITISIPPENIGFKKIISGYISALSVYDRRGTLYQKIKNVDNIVELLKADFKDVG